MKSTLHFDLDDHIDKLQFNRCLKATDVYLILWNVLHVKSHPQGLEARVEKIIGAKSELVMDEIRSYLLETMEQNGIDLNDLE